MDHHEETIANQPGEISQFKCEFCKTLFETEDELRKHQEICTGGEIKSLV